MINLDYLTLKAFEKENSDFFKGAKIQKIQQPTRKDLILSIRNKGETKKLYITVNPKFYHLAFINSETYLKRNIKIPDMPPMFCMLLRKYIDNGEITKISIPPYERIFEIHLNSINELNEKTPLCLCIELMGKHSNIILYNNETKTIIGSAHNIGPEKSKTREIRGGIPYVYPPNYKNKKDILRYFGEINYETMSDDYLGISKSFSQLCKNLPLEKIKDYVEMISEFSPAIDFENNIFSIYSELLKTPSYTNTVNEMIDTYFSNEQQKDYIENLKRKSETFLNTKIKKLENTINKIKSEINKDNSYTAFKHYGDLIINNLYNGTDFSESITVFDYEKNKNLTIPLNKNKTLKENAIHYYEKYKHTKLAKTKLDELLRKNHEEKLYYEETLYGIKQTKDIITLEELVNELSPETKKSQPKKEIPKIEEQLINGFKVYIGHNSLQNNYILTKIAKDNDIWFHTKDYAGAHIILKIPDKIKPSNEVILKCCELSKENSIGKNAGKIGIIYTEKKNLKRPPKTALAYVTYKNETEILI